MKRFITLILVLTSVTSWSQTLPSWAAEKFKAYSGKYVLSSYVKPQFLEADLSGDKKPDVAIVIERRVDKKKGILILFASTDKAFIAGAGDKFGKGGDDFEWANTWSIFKEKTTFETTFKPNGDVDSAKEVKLERPGIEIKEEEGAGGIIYFNGKEFIWIHQGD